MSDIEDMLVADVRSLEESLSKERLKSFNWEQSARTRDVTIADLKRRNEELAELLSEAASYLDYYNPETSASGIGYRIDAVLAKNVGAGTNRKADPAAVVGGSASSDVVRCGPSTGG